MKGCCVKIIYALLILLFSFPVRFSWATKCTERERKALLMFKRVTQDDNGMLTTWRDNENGDCCRWKGVHCSNETGHVQILDLRGSVSHYLNGTININLLIELHDMKRLDLSNNYLDGSNILEFIDSFTNIRYLNLSYNFLGGSIPHQLEKLPHLRYLDLSENLFHGTIPYQVGNLSKLQHLNLQGNELVGVVPYQLGSLSKLKYLNLGKNHLVGVIPYQLGNLPTLRTLKLHQNSNLTIVEFPSNFTTNLVILDLSHSNFINSAVFQWVFNFTNVQELYLSNFNLLANNLTFPSSNLNFPSLVLLDLSYNNLDSAVFQWVFNFNATLQQLYLENCTLSYHNLTFLSSNFNFPSLVILDLSSNQLTSSIFYWIFNFTSNLQQLILYDNSLEGPIPDGFGNIMNSLEILDLSFNKLKGEIPTLLWNICTLQNLNLSYNKLSGELSSFINNSSWCNRQTLRTLDLSDNQITGMLPKSIGLLSNLQYLHLDGNSLEGVITDSHFSNLSNLKSLYLSSLALKINSSWVPPFKLQALSLKSCIIGPDFPKWLQTQNDLQMLDISNARISDYIPGWFWSVSKSMEFMDISCNNFTGEIPNLQVKFHQKLRINMTSNDFEGAIPSFLSQSSELHLSKNKFSDIGLLLCGKTKDEGLAILDVASNRLSGQLPDCWNHLNSLHFLDMSNNNFSREIPPSLGSLVKMEALVLRKNSLIGELPSSLANCTNLLFLDVSENKLLGPIPSWIGGSLRQLQILSLRLNHFHGSLPLHLCYLTQIRLLDLSHNNLSNEIPPCLENFTIMSQKSTNSVETGYHMDWCNFTDCYNTFIYVQLYITLMWKGMDDLFRSPELRLIRSIDLSSNALTGEIPSGFVSLFGLVSLNLSRNHLSGKIPLEIGNWQSLEFLDLSRNQLSGTIPSSLAHIDRLSKLDLSYNNLQGKIPIGTQLQSFDASYYEGNLDLCGMPLDKKCPEDEMPSPQVIDKEDDESLFSQHFFLSLGLGFAFGFWVFLGPILFNHSWRRAYYWMVNQVTNKIYVMVAIYVARYLTVRD